LFEATLGLSIPVIRFLYTLVWVIVTPIALLRLFWLAQKSRGYLSDIAQRFGIFRAISDDLIIWVHAVSVGETRAAQPLIEQLQARFPTARIVLSQTTPTGRMTARNLFADRLALVWLPWDLPCAQRSFLRTWHPVVGIILETELWPNLLSECRVAGIPLVLANARLSQRSMRRYGWVPSLTASMLRTFDIVAAQSELDATHFRTLGATEIVVTGNLKFDSHPDEALVRLGRDWRVSLGHRRIVLLASTREDEERLLLAAIIPRVPPETIIAVVPRHPTRFDDVASIISDMGLILCRRSSGRLPENPERVWLGDSMGEMVAWYALADIAVIGGSWRPLGGQNLIEACAVGCPVIVGPHTFNFAQATADALAAGAAVRAADALEAAARVAELLEDGPRRAAMSAAGRTFAETHRGATARCMALIEPLIERRMAEAGAAHRP
jgi:3-deoxy-D-manno-octulosonic-acid transferase